MKWGWERQKPAIEALRRLNHLASPAPDKYFSDSGIATWRALEPQLPETHLRHFLCPEPLALYDELNTDNTPHHRREEIGMHLNQLGDPRHGVGLNSNGLPDIAWINIPAGEVTLDTESQEHFTVRPFRLARYPVTWVQYLAFLDAADGYCNPAWWEDRPRKEKPSSLLWSIANYPVINVSWYDALAYCRWLSVKLQLPIRLPAEWEWQWAGVGGTQQDYPSWRGERNRQRVNSFEAGIGRTVAVGLYPLARSPFGVDDMAGNVCEWCLSSYGQPSDISLSTSEARVLRGGRWDNDPGFVRASVRFGLHPGGRFNAVGFRVLCSVPHRIVDRGRR